MSVKFKIIALKFELARSDDQIKEFIEENNKFSYKQNLHKKDAEHHIIFLKKKYQKIDPTKTFMIDFENNNKQCILVMQKDNPDFVVHKMQQRGLPEGRPKKDSKQKNKVCEQCTEACNHVIQE